VRMSLRAIAGTMIVLFTGVASSAQCLGRLHDLCWFSIPGLHCMADSCWGIEDAETQQTALSQESSPEVTADQESGQWSPKQNYCGLNKFDLLYSAAPLPMDWNWSHAEISLMESRDSQDVDAYSSALVSGWEWFFKDISGRLRMRRFVAEVAITASDWLSHSNSVVTGLLGEGFNLLASVEPVVSAEAIAEAGSADGSENMAEFSDVPKPVQCNAFVPPIFVIYQQSGKDFLVPRNLIQNWNVVPEFGGSERSAMVAELVQELAFEVGQEPAHDAQELNRAFQLTVANQLEVAAEKLLELARRLKQQASDPFDPPAQVADSGSLETIK
jgi:hypothetical protein